MSFKDIEHQSQSESEEQQQIIDNLEKSLEDERSKRQSCDEEMNRHVEVSKGFSELSYPASKPSRFVYAGYTYKWWYIFLQGVRYAYEGQYTISPAVVHVIVVDSETLRYAYKRILTY